MPACTPAESRLAPNWLSARCALVPSLHAGLQDTSRPWLKPFARLPPAALPSPPADKQRKRPFIYVYDMPPAYTGRMLQYRLGKSGCAWRVWGADFYGNHSATHFNTYGIELLLHEMLLQSPHRRVRLYVCGAGGAGAHIQLLVLLVPGSDSGSIAPLWGPGALRTSSRRDAAHPSPEYLTPDQAGLFPTCYSHVQDVRPRGGGLFLRPHL